MQRKLLDLEPPRPAQVCPSMNIYAVMLRASSGEKHLWDKSLGVTGRLGPLVASLGHHYV